jgi:hypothetical protein
MSGLAFREAGREHQSPGTRALALVCPDRDSTRDQPVRLAQIHASATVMLQPTRQHMPMLGLAEMSWMLGAKPGAIDRRHRAL